MAKQFTLGCMTLRASSVDTHVGLTNIDFSANTQISGNESGSIYEDFQAVVAFAPVANLTTKCLASIFGFVGINGQCVGSAFAVERCDLIHRQTSNCQTALSGTPHIRDRISAGLLTLGSLSASRGEDATLTVMLDAITDGSNAPVARTDGVAYPATVVAQRYTLGLCAIAGSTFPDIEDVTVDFGVEKEQSSTALGSIHPDVVGVRRVLPVVTIRGRNLSKITNALLAAAATEAAHVDTVIQLIARKNAGAFEDFGGAHHITLTVSGLIAPDNIVSATSNARATHTLRLAASTDGTNAPILITTGTTYDTTPP